MCFSIRQFLIVDVIAGRAAHHAVFAFGADKVKLMAHIATHIPRVRSSNQVRNLEGIEQLSVGELNGLVGFQCLRDTVVESVQVFHDELTST